MKNKNDKNQGLPEPDRSGWSAFFLAWVKAFAITAAAVLILKYVLGLPIDF